MDTARYVFAVLVVTFLPPGVAWWFFVHPFIDFWRRVGPRLTITIMLSAMIAAMLALMVIRDRLVLTDFGTHTPLVVVAAILMAASIWIAVKRKKHLTIKVLAGIPELEAGGESGELLSDGIYGIMRHPRYVEVVVGTLAYAVFANYLGSYLVAFAAIPAIHLIVLLEEKELRERLGAEYEAYCARVPRYIPRRGARS